MIGLRTPITVRSFKDRQKECSMKKTFASQSFAVLTAALLMVGAAGCTTTPVSQDQPAAEMPPTVDSVSATSAPVSSIDDPTGGSAPVVQDSAPTSDAPLSLGASSSGRGH
jgi:hypothetical protein